MRCEVALVMICYNAKLQTELNKRLWEKIYKHDKLRIGDERGWGGGEGRDIVVFQDNYLPMNYQGRGGEGGVESFFQLSSSPPKLMTNQ